MTTQYATASYQEIIDLHTETDRVSVIGIHTPVTRTPYDMLQGFFDMFQKYHYDGCSLTMVPAARLPADPLGVSYEAGEPTIDPRDMLNPILWHGCHGESLGSVLNQFYSGAASTTDIGRKFTASIEESQPSTSQVGNDAIFESLYYRALTDNTWSKAHPQRGFRKSGLRPLVYSISTDRQYAPSNYGQFMPMVPQQVTTARDPDENVGNDPLTGVGMLGNGSANGTAGLYVAGSEGLQATGSQGTRVYSYNTLNDNQFFTSRLHGLGWLDTRSRLNGSNSQITGVDGLTGDEANDSALLQTYYYNVEEKQRINMLPRLFMGVCLLPPAYKTEQYFRLVLNHRFSFKKFRGISMRGDFSGAIGAGSVPNYYNLN